jgi:hypothetical protein
VTLGLVPPELAAGDGECPPHTDFELGNGASLGLQLPHLRGGEPVVLDRLHPRVACWRFDGAGRAAAGDRRRQGKPAPVEPVLHTLIIEPDRGQVTVVWRGAGRAMRRYTPRRARRDADAGRVVSWPPTIAPNHSCEDAAMSDDTSPDAPLAPIELAGRHQVVIHRGEGVDTVELLGRDGKLVFAIEVGERGPVLRFEGPGLTLRAAGELAIEAQDISLRAEAGSASRRAATCASPPAATCTAAPASRRSRRSSATWRSTPATTCASTASACWSTAEPGARTAAAHERPRARDPHAREPRRRGAAWSAVLSAAR